MTHEKGEKVVPLVGGTPNIPHPLTLHAGLGTQHTNTFVDLPTTTAWWRYWRAAVCMQECSLIRSEIRTLTVVVVMGMSSFAIFACIAISASAASQTGCRL
jgi:hypothetical protein